MESIPESRLLIDLSEQLVEFIDRAFLIHTVGATHSGPLSLTPSDGGKASQTEWRSSRRAGFCWAPIRVTAGVMLSHPENNSKKPLRCTATLRTLAEPCKWYQRLME